MSEVHCIQSRLRTAHQIWIIYVQLETGTRQFTQLPALTPAETICLLKAGDC